MELTCALVLLIQISYVISSPYGYGPRTGASAKAEASAVAGAYGGPGALPLNTPQSAGYSGSYSKSYSASSATASASSSASSSSFSYSGAGAGGIPSGGETGCGTDSCKFGVKGSTGSQSLGGSNAALPSLGTTGAVHYNDASHNEPKTSDCGSGNCQPTGGKDNQGSTASSNTYSSALASTGAVLQPGSSYSQDEKSPSGKPDCEGAECDSSSVSDGECSSGKCTPNVNKNPHTDIEAKCLSGNCGTTPQVGSPTSQYGTDGKCVSGQCGQYTNVGSPANEYGSNDIKVPVSTYGASNPKTNYGSQGQASTTNSISGCKYGNCGTQTKPSYTPEYPPCSSPDCNNYGQGSSSTPGNQVYDKPSTLLTTPKEDVPCSSPNCQGASTQTKPYSGNSYSSTNFGPSGQNTFTTPCFGGSCNQDHTNAPYSATSVSNALGPQITSSPSNCASGNCNSYPSTRPNGYGGSLSVQPYSPHGNANPQYTLQPSGPGCSPGSPNCNTEGKTPSPASICSEGSPTCNDAFVGKPELGSPLPYPSGPSCAPGSPNCNLGPSTTFISAKPYSELPLIPLSHHGSPPFGKKPNFISTHAGGSYSSPSLLPSPPHTSYAGYQPVPTGSGTATFGFPSGQNSITAPAYITPSSTSCTTPNCVGIGSNVAVGANTLSNPFGASSNSEKLPSYNGGFGGPSGILKPNEFKAPPLPLGPTASITPIVNNPVPCATGNCGPQSHPSPAYESYPGTQPTAGVGANAGFGGSPGILKPNEFKAPELPLSPSAASITPITNNPIPCATGNCGSQSHPSPAYGSYPGTQPTAGAGANTGFGGPPGLLKPNEFKAPALPLSPSSASITPITKEPVPCATGNCGSQSHPSPAYGSYPGTQPTAGAGANTGFGGPPGILKPNEFNIPSTVYNKPVSSSTSETKPGCISGNCGHPSAPPAYVASGSGAQATASASANANAVAYTGGFGGPPGFLKPYDEGKTGSSFANSQVAQHGPQSINGLGPHPGSYSNNGVGSHQGSYSNNGAGSHQGSYSNNGIASHQGSYSNNGVETQQSPANLATAQANAVAGAAAGAYGGLPNKDCGGNCGATGGGYGGAPSGGYGGSPSVGSYGSTSGIGSYGGHRGGTKYGIDGGPSTTGDSQAAVATAKSLSSSSGYGNSHASSSASAQATSGAAIKGSYGKR